MFRALSVHHQGKHQMLFYKKKLQSSTWSAVYVNLLVIVG
jgi:hypothetical protein